MKKFYFLALIILTISCGSDNNTLKFKKENYGKDWPFSVDEIEVYCSGYKEIYCKTTDGKIYALNGSAKGASQNDPKINKVEEIWLDNPEFEGLKIPYAQFITEGLKLCENR